MRPISVLDTQSPGEVPSLVPALEVAGFHRYWASEHYSPLQSASPLMIAALAAGLTERMRVGTAGILLRCTSAMRVAADAAALELFFPGRIDLGIAGALPGNEYTAQFVADVRVADNDAFESRVSRLKALLDGDVSLPLIGPRVDSKPDFWVCGTSQRSAELAGRLGANFAFHSYLAAMTTSMIDAAETYRHRFQMREDACRPTFAIAAYGACGSDERDAWKHWTAYSREAMAAPSFIGSPRQCADQLAELVARSNADEIVVDCFTSEPTARVDALTALAAAWHELNL